MILTGDPTDTSIKLRPLEPASGQALARDLVLKTRRRKGLGDQIAVSKYLDDEFVVSDIFFFVQDTYNKIYSSWHCRRRGTQICWDNVVHVCRIGSNIARECENIERRGNAT